MALSPELLNQIEQEMAGLSKNMYQRTGMGMNSFIGEYSGNLAQMVEDIELLVQSGFDRTKVPYFQGLLEVLSMVYGQRYGEIQVPPERRDHFEKQFALATQDRKRLAVVARHILEKSGNKDVQRSYKHIMEGSGTVDTLTDNLSLVAIHQSFPQLAGEIRPGGFTVDAAYCEEVKQRAVELLSLKGFVVEKGIPQNANVDQLNRITTLCRRAQAEIKKFASAAFYDNEEYYNSHYASENRRGAPASALPTGEPVAELATA